MKCVFEIPVRCTTATKTKASSTTSNEPDSNTTDNKSKAVGDSIKSSQKVSMVYLSLRNAHLLRKLGPVVSREESEKPVSQAPSGCTTPKSLKKCGLNWTKFLTHEFSYLIAAQ
ncbi:hypothetical protein QAD02_007250 [Eretmocerus hayati]|uniref:Uncharacterized protein n=1 Tax=Eretmocerus hayati TaxID=131215 RepID=A0ACC2N363_9HYME|nr:hypothetical protein QAD02_007250 [Eretmocerus hayati]